MCQICLSVLYTLCFYTTYFIFCCSNKAWKYPEILLSFLSVLSFYTCYVHLNHKPVIYIVTLDALWFMPWKQVVTIICIKVSKSMYIFFRLFQHLPQYSFYSYYYYHEFYIQRNYKFGSKCLKGLNSGLTLSLLLCSFPTHSSILLVIVPRELMIIGVTQPDTFHCFSLALHSSLSLCFGCCKRPPLLEL